MQIFSPKQELAFSQSYSNVNIAEGAVSSGKSHVFLYRFLDEMRRGPLNDGGKGYDYMIGGKSQSTVIRNVVRPMDAELGGIIRFNHTQSYFDLWENRVYVVGANDERSEGKIRGWTLAGALIDEVTICPQSFFAMTLSRLRRPGAKLFGTTNPDSKYHWLRTEYLEKFADDPKFLSSFKFRLDDNPKLDPEYKEFITKAYSGLWHRRFIEGEWVQAEGAIYDFFDDDIHTVEEAPTYAKYFIVGIDYGTTNAFAAVLIGFNDEVHPMLWVEKEYYWDSKVMGYQKTDAEYGRDIVREFGNYPVQFYYIDPSAKSFELELKRQHLPVKQANNDVEDGIRCVSTLLSQKDLVIKRCCRNLIKEIEGYVWDIKSVKLGKEKPLKERDHACDGLRYALFTRYGDRLSLKETTSNQQRVDKWYDNPMQSPGLSPNQSWGWQSYGAGF